MSCGKSLPQALLYSVYILLISLYNLLEKLNKIREALGSDKVFDVIGEILDLYGKKDKGEDVDKMINRKREKKHEYERGLEELKERLERERPCLFLHQTFWES